MPGKESLIKRGTRVGAALCVGMAAFIASCTDETSHSKASEPDGDIFFENCESVSVDVEGGVIELPGSVDSLVVFSLESLGGTYFYIALDEDAEDPELDWDNPLEEGAVLSLKEGEDIRIVALDDDHRVLKIWTLKNPEIDVEKSSSSEKVKSSSSKGTGSSSSEKAKSSSSKTVASSSSKKVQSSSSESLPESSSDIFESSSSAEIECSSSEMEEESSSSLSSSSAEGDGPQLPGSDFSSWDKSFWGSTSDAMATEASKSGVTMASSANAEFDSSKLTLTSGVIGGTALLITAGHKLAAGIYFAGSFRGEDCDALYNADGGYPGLENSDFSTFMDMGRPFTGRPTSFDVTFAYEHVAGGTEEFPQKALIYVLLASAENKVVATGGLVLESGVPMDTRNVELSYGADPDGLLSSGFAIPSGLELGDGTEEVAKIFVMFASSAYGHVASTNYRGGEGSRLILDEFKLNYRGS